MILGVGRGIALIGDRSLALHNRTRFHAMQFDEILAALETFADRGAALDAFRKRQHMLVIGMTATDG